MVTKNLIWLIGVAAFLLFLTMVMSPLNEEKRTAKLLRAVTNRVQVATLQSWATNTINSSFSDGQDIKLPPELARLRELDVQSCYFSTQVSNGAKCISIVFNATRPMECLTLGYPHLEIEQRVTHYRLKVAAGVFYELAWHRRGV